MLVFLVPAGLIGFWVGASVAVASAIHLATLLPALFVPFTPGWVAGWSPGLALAVFVVATVISYDFCRIGASGQLTGSVSPTSFLEWLGRGLLIGISTGINFMTLRAMPIVEVLAFPVLIINAAALLPSISNRRAYQIALSYFALIMPLALPATVLGLVVLAINGLATLFGAPLRLFIDWTSANLVTHGGVLYAPTAPGWNLGNLSMIQGEVAVDTPWLPSSSPTVRRETVRGILRHETGHTLNVGAFGTLFHLVGAVEQLLKSGSTSTWAYAELTSEGRLRRKRGRWIALWTPSSSPPAPGNEPVIERGTVEAPSMITLQTVDRELPFVRLLIETRAMPFGETFTFRAFPGGDDDTTDADGSPFPIGLRFRVGAAGETVVTTSAAVNSWTPTRGGTHTVQLWATDGAEGMAEGVSDPTTTNSSGERFFAIEVVAADPGPDLTVAAGTALSLDGSESVAGTEPLFINVLNVAFAWAITDQPAGSSPNLTSSTAQVASFESAEPGTYEVTLTVTKTLLSPNGTGVDVSHSASTTLTVA